MQAEFVCSRLHADGSVRLLAVPDLDCAGVFAVKADGNAAVPAGSDVDCSERTGAVDISEQRLIAFMDMRQLFSVGRIGVDEGLSLEFAGLVSHDFFARSEWFADALGSHFDLIDGAVFIDRDRFDAKAAVLLHASAAAMIEDIPLSVELFNRAMVVPAGRIAFFIVDDDAAVFEWS